MKKILREGVIEILNSDSGEGGMSKKVHLLKHNGKGYVLRICKDKKTAIMYSKNLKKYEKERFLPKLIEISGKKILLEYIEGRDCKKKDALRVAYQVGKIIGTINRTKGKNLKIKDIDQKFRNSLTKIKNNKVINTKTSKEILQRYYELRKNIKIQISLDCDDIVPSNFRISKGKVYLVDIEMIKENIRSRGIAKAFLRWFGTGKQREKLMKGYNSVNSSLFLTEEYLQLLYLYFLVTNMKIKIYDGLSTKGNKKRLKSFLEGKLK